MDDFSIQPGVANMYGALGGEANAIVPSKRMLSSMCPVVVTKDGKPFLVVGTPGGTTIPTSVYQTLLNMIEFNMNVSDAVNKPKFHHQHLPDEVYVEKTFPKDVRGQLENMGYKIVERSAIGRTEAIHVKGKIVLMLQLIKEEMIVLLDIKFLKIGINKKAVHRTAFCLL
jgi:gamma-glutamyltranspeptidase/glutathione hydrolase